MVDKDSHVFLWLKLISHILSKRKEYMATKQTEEQPEESIEKQEEKSKDLQHFYFPELGTPVDAESLEEAIAIANRNNKEKN
nr:MAG TPA: hypothetical protein [Caudoviricetes sp.]